MRTQTSPSGQPRIACHFAYSAQGFRNGKHLVATTRFGSRFNPQGRRNRFRRQLRHEGNKRYDPFIVCCEVDSRQGKARRRIGWGRLNHANRIASNTASWGRVVACRCIQFLVAGRRTSAAGFGVPPILGAVRVAVADELGTRAGDGTTRCFHCWGANAGFAANGRC